MVIGIESLYYNDFLGNDGYQKESGRQGAFCPAGRSNFHLVLGSSIFRSASYPVWRWRYGTSFLNNVRSNGAQCSKIDSIQISIVLFKPYFQKISHRMNVCSNNIQIEFLFYPQTSCF
jgi:hypothetical protein